MVVKSRIYYIVSVIPIYMLILGAPLTVFAEYNGIEKLRQSQGVLLMPPDLKIYQYTAGGTMEVLPDQTLNLRKNFQAGLNSFAMEKEIRTITLNDPDSLSETERAYDKLHFAVGQSVLEHYYGQFKLPNKKSVSDWSLGPEISLLRDKYQVDYALFSYFREAKSSGGRAVMFILLAAAGVGIQMGGEVGYTSLVDLKTGRIEWFKKLSGNIRTGSNDGEFADFLSVEGANLLLNEHFEKMAIQ